jgi:DNA-binding IclR family transcriptional regulator
MAPCQRRPKFHYQNLVRIYERMAMASNRSVDRALALLRQVASAGRPVRFADLLVSTGIPKATLHGLLASLEAAQFLQRTSDGYQVGIGAFEVGTAMPVPTSLRDAAAPWLDQLSEATRESCHFGLLDGGDVVYVDRRDSPGDGLRFTVRVGQRLPAYGTSLGKAMLAELDDDQVTRLYPRDLPPITERTLPTRARLLRELREVRAHGYAVESGESTPGVRCIGLAATTPHGIVGLSVTVPVHRAPADQLTTYLPVLREAIAGVRDGAVAGHWLKPRAAGEAARAVAAR